jgi:hypothetical protein
MRNYWEDADPFDELSQDERDDLDPFGELESEYLESQCEEE